MLRGCELFSSAVHQVGLNNITAMQQFVKRVVEKLGGFVPYVVPKEFAELFLHPQTSYSDLEAMGLQKISRGLEPMCWQPNSWRPCW